MVVLLLKGLASSTQLLTRCQWLLAHQNSDGGWGDTDRSHSNIATTFLVIAAVRFTQRGESTALSPEIRSAWSYVESQGKWDGLRKRYGKDKTFVVPILSNCALAGFVPGRRFRRYHSKQLGFRKNGIA